MDQIYYRIGSIFLLDPNLGNISNEIQTYWTNQVLSFQNTDGGFGAWKHDDSSISNTRNALSILTILDKMNEINSKITNQENLIFEYKTNSLDFENFREDLDNLIKEKFI